MDQEDEREEGEDTDSEDEGHPRCFEPHILEMTRDRLVYPPVEINRPGPPTNRSLPVWARRYHPYADADVHYNIMRVEKLVVVDLRNLTVADPRLPIPTGQMGVFSVLAPRNDPQGLIFPGLIWPDQFGPIDFPQISATTLGQRYEELRTIRQRVAMFIERVRRIFPDWVRKELESQEISLFSLKGRQLISHQVNRSMFFRILHPTFHPLITRDEATFLRGACYALQQFRFTHAAETVDRLLRTPQLDEHLCRRLFERGCFEQMDGLEEAERILEIYEDRAGGDAQGIETD
jgi:hypothetical protein